MMATRAVITLFMAARRKVRSALALGLAIGPLLVSVTAVPAAAMPVGQFAGMASADGLRVRVGSPGATAVDQIVEFGLPSSGAMVDTGASRGQASVVYPGETVLNGPGLFTFVTGVDAPPYPFTVESVAGFRDDDRAQFGNAVVEAHSSPLSSRATSTMAFFNTPSGAGGLVRSSSLVEIDETGAVTARAETLMEGFRYGVLQIGGLRSVASMAQGPGEPPTRTATLEITGMKVADQSVGFNQDGVVTGGSKAPFPENPAAEALRAAGITLRYLSGRETDDGVVAPALEITAQAQSPGSPAPTTVVYQFGFAAAAGHPGDAIGGLDSGSVVGVGDGADAGTGDVSQSAQGHSDTGTTAGPSLDTTDESLDLTSGSAGVGSESVSFDDARRAATMPASGPVTSGAGSYAAVPGPGALHSARLSSASGLTPSKLSSRLYLVVALGGLLALGGPVLLRGRKVTAV